MKKKSVLNNGATGVMIMAGICDFVNFFHTCTPNIDNVANLVHRDQKLQLINLDHFVLVPLFLKFSIPIQGDWV